MQEQFRSFFSEQDFEANQRLMREVAMLREDIAKTWLEEPLTIEETAERYVRPELRSVFVRLCRGSIADYIDRFGFKSDLLKAMYAVTDAFSGLAGGYDTDGTGMNFLVHNMCRLPGGDGTWMIVEGGMGTVSRALADKARELGARILTGTKVTAIEASGGAARGVVLASGERIEAKAVVANADPWRTRALVGAAFPAALSKRLDEVFKTGTTFKVNLCFDRLPTFKCLPEDRGQFGPTIHLLPDEDVVIEQLRSAHRDASEGRLPEFPSIEWYFHTPIDPTLRDPEGRHNGALFVQWVPHTLAGGKSWVDQEEKYARHLLTICDRFAPGTSDAVIDMLPLSPAGIERHFGITGGHIHHVDNGYGFADRLPYRFGLEGLYSCSAGTHPAGSVIGAAGHNAARAVLNDLGVK
jgi:phytoene dehydrogenase-like protein